MAVPLTEPLPLPARSPSPVPSTSPPPRLSHSPSSSLHKPRPAFRTISGSWGVSGIGRGFDWRWDFNKEDDDNDAAVAEGSPGEEVPEPVAAVELELESSPESPPSDRDIPDDPTPTLSSAQPPSIHSSPRITTADLPLDLYPGALSSPSQPDSPSSPLVRPSRRPPSRRISLIAGRHVPPPTDLVPEDLPPISPRITLSRANSAASLSFALTPTNANPLTPTPNPLISPETPLERAEITYPIRASISRASSISSVFSARSTIAPANIASEYDDDEYDEGGLTGFGVEGEAGRGAYGLVKRARRVDAHGLPYGPPLIIKYVIKSRILADSWKRHRTYGTIPIEIHVLLFLTSVPHLSLPRPWHPARNTFPPDLVREPVQQRGHDNVGRLAEFWEDSHYYYLVMPFEPPGGDLFDLVEANPNGLEAYDIRSLFGQIADAVDFLHSKGIIHRDLKDENVVLGEAGRCYLIDFGSCASGWREGRYWDTFSGTLDYAGPEILRGERYTGKPQDVYALGVIGYVMLVGECPYATASEAQAGLVPGSKALRGLEDRAGTLLSPSGEKPSEPGKLREGEEADGGGALADAADLIRHLLEIEPERRPCAARVLEHRFLKGKGGWVGDGELEKSAVEEKEKEKEEEGR